MGAPLVQSPSTGAQPARTRRQRSPPATTPTRPSPTWSSGTSSPVPGSSPGTSPTCRCPAPACRPGRRPRGPGRAYRRRAASPRTSTCAGTAGRVAESTGPEPASAKAIRCPYHGWTYHLDGALVGAPEGRSHPVPGPAEPGPVPGARSSRSSASCSSTSTRPRPRSPTSSPTCPKRSPLPRHRPAAGRSLPHPRHRRRGAARQLEGRRRQLPGGLPRAGGPPGPDAAARLPALHRRHRRELRLLRGAAARQSLVQPAERAYQRLASPMPGLDRRRPADMAVPGDLPEHADRLLP